MNGLSSDAVAEYDPFKVVFCKVHLSLTKVIIFVLAPSLI